MLVEKKLRVNIFSYIFGCYNQSIRKITKKRLVIFVYHLIKVFVGPGWVKLGGNISQQIAIPFVFAISRRSVSTRFTGMLFSICQLKLCLRLFHSMFLMYGNEYYSLNEYYSPNLPTSMVPTNSTFIEKKQNYLHHGPPKLQNVINEIKTIVIFIVQIECHQTLTKKSL